MPVVQRALQLVCTLTLVSCGAAEAPQPRAAPGTGADSAAQRAAAPEAGIPLLSASTPRAPERTDTPLEHRRFARDSAQALAQLERLKSSRPSAAAGCAHLTGPQGVQWGPPTPKVRATVLGHQVAVEFAFAHLPQDPACRPEAVSAAVFSGRPATSGYNALGAIGEFRLAGPRGRFLVSLPGGSAPYHLGLYVLRLDGLRSSQVVVSVPCRGACLPPDPPARTGLPSPILRPRDISRSGLERSMTEAVAHPDGYPRASAVGCPSLRVCDVRWTDRELGARYTVRYAVAGERVPGCWIARSVAVSGSPPHWPASVGNGTYVGGCVRWPG